MAIKKRPLSVVGIEISLGRTIVTETLSYHSWISCENGACEQMFCVTSHNPISVREVVDKASAAGWVLAGQRVFCPGPECGGS